jgi:hypothetical protein
MESYGFEGLQLGGGLTKIRQVLGYFEVIFGHGVVPIG